jgi:hypothetical protein
MRARNLKPGAFINEALGTGPELALPFFLGLSLVVDRKGIAEDRPLKLWVQVFPYRPWAEAEALLNYLAEQGMIVRYVSSNGTRLIHMPQFLRHQNPHPDEKASLYLTPKEETEKLRGTHGISGDPQGSPEIPQGCPAESGLLVSLNPDSRSTEGGIPSTPIHRSAEGDSSEVESPPGGQVQDVEFLAGRKQSAEPSTNVSEALSHPAVQAVVAAWRDICTPKDSVFMQPKQHLIDKYAPVIRDAAESDPSWLPTALEVIAWLPSSDFNAGRRPPREPGGKPYIQSFPALMKAGMVREKYSDLVDDQERKAKFAKAAALQVQKKSKGDQPSDALNRREKARKEKAERERLEDEAHDLRDADADMEADRLAAERLADQ